MGILTGVSDFFGLDIGVTAIRVVQLSGNAPNKTVFRYGKFPINSQLAMRDDDQSLEQLAENIREALIQYHITTRNVVVGLPMRNIYSVSERFAGLQPKDLAKTIKFQLGSLIPSPLDTVKVDYAVLDSDTQDDPAAETEVFVCSIDKQFVERRLELLESINLNVLAFEPDALAILRTVASRDAEPSILVDVGYRHTDIIGAARNQPRMSPQTLNFGISNIIREVMSFLNVEEMQALELIFKVGMKGDESHRKLASIIIDSSGTLVNQMRKTIDFLKGLYGEDYALSKIVLWGDVVYIPGFSDFLAQTFNLEVAVGDTWQNVNCPQTVQSDLQVLSASFAVASGLAQRQKF